MNISARLSPTAQSPPVPDTFCQMLKSYIKTFGAGMVLLAGSAMVAAASTFWLAGAPRFIVVFLSALLGLCSASVALASAVVIARYRRSIVGQSDLFLALNRPKEPEAVRTAREPGPARVRRWLARRWAGHDLLVGDWVEVKSWHEIQATLDDTGSLRKLPFMPEMLPMCGRRARVFRCVHRIFDYRKTRRMRHLDDAVLLVGALCDGSSHGECEAACHTLWRSAWLRRINPEIDERERTSVVAAPVPAPPSRTLSEPLIATGTAGPNYVCQLTRLHDASRAIGGARASQLLLPLISGNVTRGAFVVGWLTYLFNEVQELRQGVGFPAFEAQVPIEPASAADDLRAGDQVIVRSSGQIRSTLNDQLMHRGLWFEPDMLKHCGQCRTIQAPVTRLIDIVTGEMRTMKTPAYILEGVHFSGERQLFNAQFEPLFWRAAWLVKSNGR